MDEDYGFGAAEDVLGPLIAIQLDQLVYTQERDRRYGTPDVVGAIGVAEALRVIANAYEDLGKHTCEWSSNDLCLICGVDGRV